jgi:predicted tellurium resistance membrane protein TerC
MLLDVVFSMDSVLTAIGMAEHIEVMIAAVTIAIGVMLWMSGPIAAFIQKHPTTKMLALSFLLLIGMALVADGFGTYIPRGYFYFAIAFSALVEVLNLSFAARRKRRLQANQGS